MFCFHGTISIKSTRERSPIWKQTMAPPRHAWPLGTNTQLWYNVSLPRYNLYQENKREITRMVNHGTTAARLSYCWIGHKYPVPSSPPHAPRSGARWPNGMEYFTPFSLETNCLLVWNLQFFPFLDGSGHIFTGSVLKYLIKPAWGRFYGKGWSATIITVWYTLQ